MQHHFTKWKSGEVFREDFKRRKALSRAWDTTAKRKRAGDRRRGRVRGSVGLITTPTVSRSSIGGWKKNFCSILSIAFIRGRGHSTAPYTEVGENTLDEKKALDGAQGYTRMGLKRMGKGKLKVRMWEKDVPERGGQVSPSKLEKRDIQMQPCRTPHCHPSSSRDVSLECSLETGVLLLKPLNGTSCIGVERWKDCKRERCPSGCTVTVLHSLEMRILVLPVGLKKCERKDTEGGGRALWPLCLCKYATCWTIRVYNDLGGAVPGLDYACDTHREVPSFKGKAKEFSKSGMRRIEPLTFSWSIVAVSNSDEQK
ncbi:hypothetical protein QQF64_011437 [Cirrhinus molitorella]|uniref:Uncharacterized protein n=1 Tax=Cirrhinus molitorella TaxID=172907 RepID=A0ABR3LZ99_9TELE